MEKPESAKPVRRGFRLIAWICGSVLVFVILLVVGNVSLVIYEINRTDPHPDLKPVLLVEAVPESAPVQPKPAAAELSTNTADVRPSDAGSTVTVVLMPDLIHLGPTDLPESVDQDVKDLNACYSDTIKKLAACQKELPSLSYKEGIDKLQRCMLEWGDVVFAKYHRGDSRIRTPLADGPIRLLHDTYDRLMLDFAVKHQKWYEAASIVRQRRMGWPTEVYYLKKMGDPGRRIIAMRTSQRYWEAISYSVRSIGPNFHLPRLEDN